MTELEYIAHEIIKGKNGLQGLPSTYVEKSEEATTLVITTVDTLTQVKVILTYTVFEAYDAIIRSVKFVNEGTKPVLLENAQSMCVDFIDSRYDLLQLSGSWVRERSLYRTPLRPGIQMVDSKRGASSHQQNPFIALLRPDTTENKGDIFGFNFVYSGSFSAQVEVEQYGTTRVMMGINPHQFGWNLGVGEMFQTPEVVMAYSHEGIGGMSRIYHKLYRERLCRGAFRDKVRPVLINNWEATYWDFNAEKIEAIAEVAKDLGIELVVLDDGWFGKRNDYTSSLGDWVVDHNKLPKGLEDLAKRVREKGLAFGLWFEPEMVSPESQLYKQHPDWCLHVKGRRRSQGRNQLVLDLSRQDVCDYIIESVSSILSSAPITYVKWDMNRHMSEVGSALLDANHQKEVTHRYMLGLYHVLEVITTKYPHILFESCSGGGGRFDPGMLYYMPQIWTSDNTDAVCRLFIQYGTSIVYPVSTMGSHVSAVPNHQVHRNTSIKMRGDVAMSGNFGYELDATVFTDEEKEEVKCQVAQYKELREFIQFGDMYRLLSPFEGNAAAWMYVSEDKTKVFVAYFKILAQPNEPNQRLYLEGLDPNRQYKVKETGEILGGDELMYVGISIPVLQGDYQSKTWILEILE